MIDLCKVGFVLMICCELCGCSSGVQTELFDEVSLTLPDEFEEKGVKWMKSSEISDADIRLLTNYFRDHPSVAEGSHIRGQPTVYTTPTGMKRFYWIRSGVEAPEWLYVMFQGRKAKLQEGQGGPFAD